MKTFLAAFHGRKLGAIGIRYHIVVTVEGEDLDDAKRNLNNRYQDISDLVLV